MMNAPALGNCLQSMTFSIILLSVAHISIEYYDLYLCVWFSFSKWLPEFNTSIAHFSCSAEDKINVH